MDYIEKFKNYTTRQTVNLIMKALINTSDENLIRLTYAAERIAPHYKEEIKRVRTLFQDKAPAYILAQKALKEIHPNYRDRMVLNFMVNTLLLGSKKRAEFEKKENSPAPFTIVISPTMRCNLKCADCYAGDYSKEDDLPIELVDKVITEAKEFGTNFFTISGGEPFVRDDMLDIYEKHNDAAFMIYTNGTFIDKDMAKKLTELGNVAPAISIEGFEEETDTRRGKGIWQKIMNAMDYLEEEGVIFGFSGTPTRYNTEAIYSDELIKSLTDKGCVFGWYFTYIPIGRNPNVDLMQTPKQRLYGWRRVNYLRSTYPIFIGDFWNDGMHTEGCIAGGRRYLHINVHGDIEPCVFTHFATQNIRNTTLREAMNSPLFRAIRARQPYNKNLMLPCMIIDNPEIYREIYNEIKPRPTHENAETIFTKCKEHLDKYSKEYEKLSEPFWEKVYENNGEFPKNIPKKSEEIEIMLEEEQKVK